MKSKVFFIAVTFLLMGMILEAQETVQFSWDLSSISTGIQLPQNENNEAKSEFLFGLFNFHLGYRSFIFSFDAINYCIFSPITRIPEHMIMQQKLYFINVDLFSAALNAENISFGPFGSINYLCLSNWEKFEFDAPMTSTGLRLVIQTKEKDAKLPLWFSGAKIETGIRNIGADFVIYWNWAFTIRYYSRKNRT